MSLRPMHDVQIIDSRIDTLKTQKDAGPEKTDLTSRTAIFERIRSQKEGEEAEMAVWTREQKRLEDELAAVARKSKVEEGRLYGGKVTNPKELAALQQEIQSLSKLGDMRETELLETMEKVETYSTRVFALDRKLQEARAEMDESRAVYEAFVVQADEETSRLEGERQVAWVDVPPEAQKLYDRLRIEKHGIAVVNLTDGVCTGCHIELPAQDVDKMVDDGTLWRCPHCRRLVVRLS